MGRCQLVSGQTNIRYDGMENIWAAARPTAASCALDLFSDLSRSRAPARFLEFRLNGDLIYPVVVLNASTMEGDRALVGLAQGAFLVLRQMTSLVWLSASRG